MDKGPKSGQRELAGVPWWTSWSGVPLVAGTVLALVQAVLWPGCTSMEGGTEEKEVSGCSGSHSPTMTSARASGVRTLALALRAPQWVLPYGRGLHSGRLPRPPNRGTPSSTRPNEQLLCTQASEGCHPLRLTLVGGTRQRSAAGVWLARMALWRRKSCWAPGPPGCFLNVSF